MNEELRAATEELETSREELQSINEELTTVNVELKSKVDELGHSNSDMHNLMDATAIATVFLNRELQVMRYTPSAVSLFNLIPSDLGRPLGDLATRLDYPQLSDDARRVLDKLVPIEREVGLPDGNWFLTRLLPYRTMDDRIAGVVLSFINITERKQAEEVRRWLSAVVASTPDAILSFAPDHTILSWNAGARAMFGYTAEEAIGQPLLMLARSEEEGAALLAKLRETEAVAGFETCHRCKDGSEVHVSLSISPIRGDDGRVIGGTAIARDITEARRAAEALRVSEERLRLMVENASDYAIFSSDLERRITIWNTGAERLLGYTEQEALGQPSDMIFTAEDRAAGVPVAEAAMARAEGRAGDDRFHQRKDGSRFWASGSQMLMRDQQGHAVGFVKVLRDQSAARAAQQALERSQEELRRALDEAQAARDELESADAAKDRFLAVLSHELRNPLASIASSSELLETPEVGDEELSHAALVIKRQSRAMKVLLDDLLDVSRVRLGRLALRKTAVTLASVVESALEATQPLVEAARHQLTVQLPSTDVVLDADPLRLGQVVSNLVSNAVKYTPEGGHIGITAELAGNEVVLTVTDSGIGMEPAEIERMFELFSQAPGALERASGGLGIGLALSRSIVELHGGWIHASSAGPGQGSEFKVGIPYQHTARQPAAAPPPPAAAPQEPQQQPLVMIADDNGDAAWGIAKLLELSGFRTVLAGGGEEALRVAERDRPDVALLDIGMPDLSGHEVARRLRASAWGRDMVLIAATGWGQDVDRQRSVQAGFDAHLTKPLNLGRIKEEIGRLLAHRDA